MSLGIILAVLLLVKASNTLHDDDYKVPQPLIEVLHPRGFRINIADSTGISYVSFQIKINKYLYRHNSGWFVGNVRQAVDGRWTFEEHNVRLKIGDKVYYETYVVKDRLGYRTAEGKYFQVKELPSIPLEGLSLQSTQPTPCKTCSSNHNSQTYPTTPSPETIMDSYSLVFQELFLNCSENVSILQSELESLRKTNQQLTALIEKQSDSKQLTLSGRIPPDEDAATTANFIIREKLDLIPNIVSAVRKEDRSIVFEVATLSEKLEILEVAKEKLRNSRIVIT